MTSLQLGKNNFKAPFFFLFFFCNVTYFIKVLPKINTVTMNMLGGLAEIELDTDQWTGRRLILSRSEVNSLLLKSATRSWRMKKISLSHQILFERFHVTIVCFQRCFFFLSPSQIRTLTEMPQTGVIGVQGRLPQITVITRNDLFHENSHACHFMFECGGQMPVELWVTALCNSFLTH